MIDDRDRELLDAYSAAVTAVVQRVVPSVASLKVTSRRGEGSGSASVLTADGYLLTSAHVVEGASTAVATFAAGLSRWPTSWAGTPSPIWPCSALGARCQRR